MAGVTLERYPELSMRKSTKPAPAHGMNIQHHGMNIDQGMNVTL
jgi:hypothetical protein